jgi:hypothetical protein
MLLNKTHRKNAYKCPGLRYPANRNAHVLRVRSAFNSRDALPGTLIHIFAMGFRNLKLKDHTYYSIG